MVFKSSICTTVVVASLLISTAQPAEASNKYKSYAKTYMKEKYGWGNKQFSCLSKLWHKESNWNPKAHNKSSGAHGIPQALPGSKMGKGWRTDGKKQIRWGLKYIKKRYGNPCKAWGHSQNRGWY